MNWRRSAPWFGAAGMAVVLWPYASIGLVAPWWMVPLMLGLWAFLFALLLANVERRPLLGLAMPFVAVAVWVAVVFAGGAWLGWTA